MRDAERVASALAVIVTHGQPGAETEGHAEVGQGKAESRAEAEADSDTESLRLDRPGETP